MMTQQNCLKQPVSTLIIIIYVANYGWCGDDITFKGPDQRMNGGIEPPKHAYPFVVLLQERKDGVFTTKCNGILIDDDMIITVPSATCTLTVEVSRALAGMHNQTNLTEHTRQIRDVCFIESSQFSGNKNRYMVLHLSEPFHLNEYVRAIALPRIKNVAKVDGECIVGGWTSSSNIPNHKTVKIKTCTSGGVDKTIICTEPGPCTDYGSPLVCTRGNREFAVGVFHGAYNCKPTEDAVFSATLGIDYKWLDEMKKKAVKKCRNYE